MKRYALALDLKDDPQLIAEYEAYHKNVWPEITQAILDSGIVGMEIYRLGTRLFMSIETEDDFSFEKKAIADQKNSKTQEWEDLMERYQQRLSIAKPGEKWSLMSKIFELKKES
ncbi:L-rhamnose mutarotase [Spongiimicrobium sp. 3-5]|uniref:L-rhamnose mutarotase n=1 Tax=Spongiimicrobium sp. 3-5 TaxID=3332596 RepID=UPI00397EDCC5